MLAVAGEVKGLKAQCNSLADAAQAEKFELLAAKQENDRLNDQIVQVRNQSRSTWCAPAVCALKLLPHQANLSCSCCS
jgi:hypothetical protein